MTITSILLGLLSLTVPPEPHGGQIPQPPPPWDGPQDFRRGGRSGATPAGPTPANPGTGRAQGPSGGPNTGPGARRGTPVVTLGTAPDSWSFWWLYNREVYLNLRRRLEHVPATTDSPEFYLGLRGEDSVSDLGLAREIVKKDILPIFVDVLTQSEGRQPDEISSALIAIARLKVEPHEAAKSIRPHLQSANQEIREVAALALGILGAPDELPLLTALAQDDARGRALVRAREVDVRTRSFAAYGLGIAASGWKDEASAFHRRVATRALVQLLRDVRTSSREVRVAALSALGLVPTDADVREGMVLPELRRMLSDEKLDDVVRAHVPTAIARLGAIYECDALVARLANKREKALVRQSLLLALGTMAPSLTAAQRATVTAEILRQREHARSPEERNFALIALGQLGTPKAIEFLTSYILEGRRLDRPWAALALGVHAYASPEESVDRVALADLVRRARAQIASPDLRGAFSISLALLGDRDAEPLLLEEMRESRIDEVRGHAAVGLGLLRATTTAAEIRKLIGTSKRRPDLIRELSIALGLLGDREAVPTLVDLLVHAKGNATRGVVAQALGRIGDVRSIEPLRAMVLDPKIPGLARSYAITALGVIGEADDLPWNTALSTGVNYRAVVDTLVGLSGVIDII